MFDKVNLFRNSNQTVSLVTSRLGQYTVECSPIQSGYTHQARQIIIEVNIPVIPLTVINANVSRLLLEVMVEDHQLGGTSTPSPSS